MRRSAAIRPRLRFGAFSRGDFVARRRRLPFRMSGGREGEDFVGVEGVAVPDATDFDLVAVCRLARTGLGLYRDRNRRRQVVVGSYGINWNDKVSHRGALRVTRARCPVNDQTLETLRRWMR